MLSIPRRNMALKNVFLAKTNKLKDDDGLEQGRFRVRALKGVRSSWRCVLVGPTELSDQFLEEYKKEKSRMVPRFFVPLVKGTEINKL